MRLCRFEHRGKIRVGLYSEQGVVPLGRLAAELQAAIPEDETNLLAYLPPEGKAFRVAALLAEQFAKWPPRQQEQWRLPMQEIKLLVPIPQPNKVILLAGNYAEHVAEGGGIPPERQETFPYFFWKPPSTTLTHPGDPIVLPKVSPDHIDWEIELGVVIGKRCRHVSEKEALQYVAGYTICNDVSDRRFRINPQRKPRDKDAFFDWLHGKWHDSFLPCGPCIRSAHVTPDPQKLRLRLRVNGQTMQDACTGQMIFPVASLIAILSSFVTLEPGDIISTGTPAGVGAARKPPVFLKPGDVVECEIESIGILRNPVVREA
jgi:2-keto-4-pentenoate hydratase/2-oxohepta-3-ene-1,7-dioic acid hydratase in catechol pathway